jgi:hypothetical protein
MVVRVGEDKVPPAFIVGPQYAHGWESRYCCLDRIELRSKRWPGSKNEAFWWSLLRLVAAWRLCLFLYIIVNGIGEPLH